MVQVQSQTLCDRRVDFVVVQGGHGVRLFFFWHIWILYFGFVYDGIRYLSKCNTHSTGIRVLLNHLEKCETNISNTDNAPTGTKIDNATACANFILTDLNIEPLGLNSSLKVLSNPCQRPYVTVTVGPLSR